jgi:hypothetical protein
MLLGSNLNNGFHFGKFFIAKMAFHLMPVSKLTHGWHFGITQAPWHLRFPATTGLEGTTRWWVHCGWDITLKNDVLFYNGRVRNWNR